MNEPTKFFCYISIAVLALFIGHATAFRFFPGIEGYFDCGVIAGLVVSNVYHVVFLPRK